jgi:hypothetical protein
MRHQSLRPLVLVFLFSTANSLPADEPAFSVANIRSFSGLTPTVSTFIQDSTNVVAVQFDLTYDSTRLTALDVPPGSAPANHVVRSREIAPGLRRVLLYSLDNSSITLTNVGSEAFAHLVNVPFFVQREYNSGTVSIVPGNVHLVREDGSLVDPVNLAPGSVLILSLFIHPDTGAAEFFLPAESGSNYVVEATEDFTTWTGILTNTATDAFLDIVDTDAVFFDRRFYRSRLLDGQP